MTISIQWHEAREFPSTPLSDVIHLGLKEKMIIGGEFGVWYNTCLLKVPGSIPGTVSCRGHGLRFLHLSPGVVHNVPLGCECIQIRSSRPVLCAERELTDSC